MKELQLKNEIKTEISVKQKKKVEHELIGKIIPYDGHILWEINKETMEINKAEYIAVSYSFTWMGAPVKKKEVIVKEGHSYVSAMNKRNALKQFKNGKNGSKERDESCPEIGYSHPTGNWK